MPTQRAHRGGRAQANELTPAEMAWAFNAAMNYVQSLARLHSRTAPNSVATMHKCVGQVERLLKRLQEDLKNMSPKSP